MLLRYRDDGPHFKHNKIPHKITYGLVSTEGWPLNTGKNNKAGKTNTGLLQGGRGRLIEVAA